MIVFFDPHAEKVIGSWILDGGTIKADARTENILTAALRRSSPAEAWERYRSWTNGYVASYEVDDETKDYDPTQRRVPKGTPVVGGRWVSPSGVVKAAMEAVLEPDSNFAGTTPGQLFGKGFEAMFPEGSAPSRAAPWPSFGRRKDVKDYDQELVTRTLLDPPELSFIDPRTLRATQPAITSSGVDFYYNDPSYRETGKTFETGENLGNRYPFIYQREDGQNLILSGHHRAATALAKGEALQAIIISGPWGPPRKSA